jgi:hypothetical protein
VCFVLLGALFNLLWPQFSKVVSEKIRRIHGIGVFVILAMQAMQAFLYWRDATKRVKMGEEIIRLQTRERAYTLNRLFIFSYVLLDENKKSKYNRHQKFTDTRENLLGKRCFLNAEKYLNFRSIWMRIFCRFSRVPGITIMFFKIFKQSKFLREGWVFSEAIVSGQ